MKKIFYLIALLNCGSITLGSGSSTNKQVIKDICYDALETTYSGVKGTAKIIIPGATVACLTHEAWSSDLYSSRSNDTALKFALTGLKSGCAFYTYMTLIYKKSALRTFSGAHAIFLLPAAFGIKFCEKKADS